MSSCVAGHGRLHLVCSVWLGMAPSFIVWLSTATVSSPTTLLVSRNVAIDCVQLQIRVHSAQQQCRALLASLGSASFKNDSIVCVCLFLGHFSRRRQNCHTAWTNQIAACTCSNTSSRSPAPAHGHRHWRQLCWIWRQNSYYAIHDEYSTATSAPLPMLYLSLLAATLTLYLCCFPPGLCSWGLHWTWISVTTAKLFPSGSTRLHSL